MYSYQDIHNTDLKFKQQSHKNLVKLNGWNIVYNIVLLSQYCKHCEWIVVEQWLKFTIK